MVVPIILLCLIIIICSLLICFLYYILFPSIQSQVEIKDDPIIAFKEIHYNKEKNEAEKKSDLKAFVLCSCNKKFDVDTIKFNKENTCFLINSQVGTGTDCKFSCIGLGDCKKVCPQEAISITNKTAVISDLCIGCGKCVDACPLGLIKLIPKDTKQLRVCSNCENDITTCSDYNKEEKISWNTKKDFKIWRYCYRILTRKK